LGCAASAPYWESLSELSESAAGAALSESSTGALLSELSESLAWASLSELSESVPPAQLVVRAAPTANEPAATARERKERRSTRTLLMSSSVSGVGDESRSAIRFRLSGLGISSSYCNKARGLGISYRKLVLAVKSCPAPE